MAGIRVTSGDNSTIHSVVWVNPDEVPVSFIVVKYGAMGIATPDYIAEELYDIATGDRTLGESWDALMVKVPQSSHPEICRVRMIGSDGAAEILVGSHIVHRFS
jgi:hypothetical protein